MQVRDDLLAMFEGTHSKLTNFWGNRRMVFNPDKITVVWKRDIGDMVETLNRFFNGRKLLYKYQLDPSLNDYQMAIFIDVRGNDYHLEGK